MMRISISIVLALVLACGSSSQSGKSVKDTANRTCTIPDEGMTLSCDQPPKPGSACTGGASACFVQGVMASSTGAAVIGPAAVCAACCNGNTSTSGPNDCAQIVCHTVDDCPHGSSKCNNGGCF
jgi:hypothetical protein